MPASTYPPGWTLHLSDDSPVIDVQHGNPTGFPHLDYIAKISSPVYIIGYDFRLPVSDSARVRNPLPVSSQTIHNRVP